MPATARRSTSITLDKSLLDEARALGVNISRAAEIGIAAELKKARTEAWKRENAEAIAEMNRYVAENGLPLRPFWLDMDQSAEAV